MSSGVARAAASGVKWGGASQLLTQVIQFGSVVVLARLLVPSEFGLAAIVYTFTAFAMLFTHLGINAWIVHKRDLSDADLTTAFWLNVVSSIVLTIGFIVAAPLISRAYDEPRLAPLIVVGSLSFGLSLGIVPTGLLERSMRFKALALVEPTALVIAFSVAVGLVAAGLEAMALVAGAVAATAWRTVLLWSLARWRPTGPPSRQALRSLWAYSSSLFGFHVGNYWARNADNFLIGAFVGPAPLALYSRAYNLMLIPVHQTWVLGRVLFPALVTLRDEPERLRTAYLRSLQVLAAVTFPLSAGLAAASTAIVAVVLGGQWAGVATLLAILSLSGPAQVISGTTGALYQAVGRTDLLMKRGLGAAGFGVVAIVIGLYWGATGVAAAVSLSYVTLMPLVTRPAWRLIGLRQKEVFLKLAPVAACAGLMALAVLAIGRLLDYWPMPLLLLAQVALGSLVYVLLLRVFAQRALRELIRAARRRVRASPAG